jgi:hypothetical protein
MTSATIATSAKAPRGACRFATAIAFALFALLSFAATTPAADNAFIRVNQLGYLTGSPAHAYLMSKGTESGATFQILNVKGVALFTAPIGASASGENSTSSRSTSLPPLLATSQSK